MVFSYVLYVFSEKNDLGTKTDATDEDWKSQYH